MARWRGGLLLLALASCLCAGLASLAPAFQPPAWPLSGGRVAHGGIRVGGSPLAQRAALSRGVARRAQRLPVGPSLLPHPAVAARRAGLLRLGMSSDGDSEEPSSMHSVDSLVLVKGKEPGVVQKLGEGKCDVLMPTKKTRKIKDKDMVMLHPGPVRSWELYELGEDKTAPASLVKQVFEGLSEEGEAFSIEDLSTLLFNDYTHTTAWASWKLVEEDVYFHGTPEELFAYPQERVKKLLVDRKAATKAQKERDAFLQRLKDNALTEEDHKKRLGDVEDLALGRAQGSPLLKELGYEQSPEVAHKLLLDLEHWDETVCPWPERCGMRVEANTLSSPAVRKEQRRDFTNMRAFAIDPENILDPDDAISVTDDGKIWVHVSDVSSCVGAGSELDVEARSRGSSAYLPDGCVSMLPWDLTKRLAVGMDGTSPTLSVGFRLGDEGTISDIEICKTTVKATRMSYSEAHERIEAGEAPLAGMYALAMRFRERREAAGAAGFQFPEADVTVGKDFDVTITEVPLLTSNDLVMEFMLMAGEAVADFALSNNIPFLFSSQPAPLPKQQPQKQRTVQKNVASAAQALQTMKKAQEAADAGEPEGPPRTLAEMFAMRRRMQRSSIKTAPEFHHGLGMGKYTQFTSPLRRYGDLVAHQQIRAFLDGQQLMTEEELMQRVAATEEAAANCRKAERLSKQHWSLVWLSRRPVWEGSGICVDIRQNRPGGARIASVLIPEIGFFCNVKLKKDVRLDSEVDLVLHGVRLPELRADMVQNIPQAVLYGTQAAEEYKVMMKARKNVGTRLNERVKKAG